MAFGSGIHTNISNVQSGECIGSPTLLRTYTSIATDLRVGRFAFSTGNGAISKSTTSNRALAGVVVRNVATALEYKDFIKPNTATSVDVLFNGLITVDAVPDANVKIEDSIYVVLDETGDDLGKATTNSTGTYNAVKARFHEKLNDDVWVIRMYY